MKRYLFDTLIGSASAVTILKRGTDKFILNNEEKTATGIVETNYNDSSVYIKNRAVSLIPESTALNTVISNDGLVAVIYDGKVSIVDLFENSTYDYDNDIQPVDYQQLIDAILSIPEHTKTFSFYGDGINPVEVNNLLYYQDETHSYFTSEFDLDLETDEYGYYKVLTTS